MENQFVYLLMQVFKLHNKPFCLHIFVTLISLRQSRWIMPIVMLPDFLSSLTIFSYIYVVAFLLRTERVTTIELSFWITLLIKRKITFLYMMLFILYCTLYEVNFAISILFLFALPTKSLWILQRWTLLWHLFTYVSHEYFRIGFWFLA